MRNVERCIECPLAKPDLKIKVLIGQAVTEFGAVIDSKFSYHIYCGHFVKMVDPEARACKFIKQHKK